MRTDLNLVTNTTDGTKKTNKLSYVNPDANDGTLTTLANKIADLSNDTLTGATKTDTTDIPINATPIRVYFYGGRFDSTILTRNVNDINNETIITICAFSNDSTEDEQTELPIMVTNLMPYVKENNTRVQVSIYKDTSEGQEAYAFIGLAITPSSGTNDKEEDPTIIPTFTGDIVIGIKVISGNYINMAPDLIIRVVRE